MARRLLASILLCTAVAVQAPARGALYEFKLEGVVSYTLLPDVHIGDVAVMTFRVDDQDLEPSPNLGRYVAVGAVEVAFPEKSLVVGGSSGYFEVKLNNGNAEITQYLNQGSELSLNIPFRFPDGTLLPDHLPLSLPLALNSCP